MRAAWYDRQGPAGQAAPSCAWPSVPPVGSGELQNLLSSSFRYYADRTTRRLAGLTDDEYFWEPVAGCWTVRRGHDGFVHDWAWPPPDPHPVTTIAWRIVHICSFLQEHAMRGVAFERAENATWGPPTVIPGSAADALAALQQAIARWRADLEAVDDGRLWEPMGPAAGPFGDSPVAGFVEHIHDEFIHHSAEVALLRDLYRARFPPDQTGPP